MVATSVSTMPETNMATMTYKRMQGVQGIRANDYMPSRERKVSAHSIGDKEKTRNRLAETPSKAASLHTNSLAFRSPSADSNYFHTQTPGSVGKNRRYAGLGNLPQDFYKPWSNLNITQSTQGGRLGDYSSSMNKVVVRKNIYANAKVRKTLNSLPRTDFEQLPKVHGRGLAKPQDTMKDKIA